MVTGWIPRVAWEIMYGYRRGSRASPRRSRLRMRSKGGRARRAFEGPGPANPTRSHPARSGLRVSHAAKVEQRLRSNTCAWLSLWKASHHSSRLPEELPIACAYSQGISGRASSARPERVSSRLVRGSSLFVCGIRALCKIRWPGVRCGALPLDRVHGTQHAPRRIHRADDVGAWGTAAGLVLHGARRLMRPAPVRHHLVRRPVARFVPEAPADNAREGTFIAHEGKAVGLDVSLIYNVQPERVAQLVPRCGIRVVRGAYRVEVEPCPRQGPNA
eukprot:scaffold57350_cov69-Phaeocystis_antarctica.AAC.8